MNDEGPTQPTMTYRPSTLPVPAHLMVQYRHPVLGLISFAPSFHKGPVWDFVSGQVQVLYSFGTDPVQANCRSPVQGLYIDPQPMWYR